MSAPTPSFPPRQSEPQGPGRTAPDRYTPTTPKQFYARRWEDVRAELDAKDAKS